MFWGSAKGFLLVLSLGVTPLVQGEPYADLVIKLGLVEICIFQETYKLKNLYNVHMHIYVNLYMTHIHIYELNMYICKPI